MANTITGLIPTLYNKLDVVSRELVGFIPSCRRDAKLERAALDQTITTYVTPAATSSSISPSMTIPEGTAQTIGNRTLSISASESVTIPWEGEEARSLMNGDQPQFGNIKADQIEQGFRTLVNKIELAAAATYIEASRATGTSGTTPFSSSLGDAAQAKKILDDNGAGGDRSMIINTTAGAAMRTLANLTQVNSAGSDRTLREGVLLDLANFMIRESAQITDHTIGTASGATTDNAGYAVGATTITLASAGTGTILAGDVITFAGDTNQYVVTTGDADVSGGGTVVLAAPGLRAAIAASATAITVTSAYTPNMAFPRSALDLVVRLPALPDDGDAAADRTVIQDPWSGLVFDVAYYKGYHKNMIEIGAAWGTRISKPEHVVILKG